jgi:hypothetical protein
MRICLHSPYRNAVAEPCRSPCSTIPNETGQNPLENTSFLVPAFRYRFGLSRKPLFLREKPEFVRFAAPIQGIGRSVDSEREPQLNIGETRHPPKWSHAPVSAIGRFQNDRPVRPRAETLLARREKLGIR